MLVNVISNQHEVNHQVTNENDSVYQKNVMALNTLFSYICSKNSIFKVKFKEGFADLFTVYLNSFPQEDRQYHNCSTCKNFINTKGGMLVYIDEDFKIRSAYWSEKEITDEPNIYNAVKAMREYIEDQNNIESFDPFIVDRSVKRLGAFQTNDKEKWKHFAADVHSSLVNKSMYFETSVVIANLVQKQAQLKMSIVDFRNIENLTLAIHILKTDALYKKHSKYYEKAETLKKSVEEYFKLSSNNRNNFLWKKLNELEYIAGIRSEGIGKFIKALEEDGVDTAKSLLNKIIDPTNYMRPKAEAAEGNIKRADEIIKKYDLESAFARTPALMEEIPNVTRFKNSDVEEPKKKEGFFSSEMIKEKEKTTLSSGEVSISWYKFLRDILPGIKSMRLLPSNFGNSFNPNRLPFFGILTATNKDSKPIFKYDNPDKRNQLSVFTYKNGSSLHTWVKPDTTGKERNNIGNVNGLIDILAMVNNPGSENDKSFPTGIMIDGLYINDKTPLGIFPESLIQPLYEVRSTIEQFSNSKVVDKREGNHAVGVNVCVGMKLEVINTDNIETVYLINNTEDPNS
jgi:hypothetical protein